MTSTPDTKNRPIALVLGFNIHGLAVARALARNGVEVHAVTPYPSMPTTATRYAKVHVREGVDKGHVLPFLLDFAQTELIGRKAVLFPTNDRLVQSLGTNWEDVPAQFLLSWSDSAAQILELISKDNLPGYCRRAGIKHPHSITARSLDECLEELGESDQALMVKPAHPQSGFKALIVRERRELEKVFSNYPDDLPFVVQQYIDGDTHDHYFCSMYVHEGKALAAMTGRKLCAHPPNTGQGTVMTAESNDEVLALSQRFVDHLEISGPVSIEYKRDPSGEYWMIEPNVGRTEYCVDLAIQSGLNLPQIEFDLQTGGGVPTTSEIRNDGVSWYDTEKDLWCFLSQCWRHRGFPPQGKQAVFPYWGHADPATFRASLFRPFTKLAARIAGRFR